MYIWNATNKEISQLFAMDESAEHYVTSVAWIQKGNVLAVGTSKSTIELWDVQKQTCLRQMKSTHASRIGSLTWNKHVLSAGSRSGEINHHDVRVAQHHVGTLRFHDQEVCGLKWSPDGRHLASGANDNLVGVWDASCQSSLDGSAQPVHVLREHTAAVKAIAWCPWQSNVLATGGGTADGHIRVWNIYNGSILQSADAKSQVSSILWSRNYKELISSHGHQHNQLTLWKYSDMSKVCELTGHTNRVLMMAISPDEETVASIGADETLRLWKCFALDERSKKSNNSTLGDSMSHTSLSRSIR
jgi:cell division cycle protein 20 (cofactor of APC complex)